LKHWPELEDVSPSVYLLIFINSPPLRLVSVNEICPSDILYFLKFWFFLFLNLSLRKKSPKPPPEAVELWGFHQLFFLVSPK